MGPNGGVSRAIFPIMAWSFQSYVKINQLNASVSKISRVALSKLVNMVMHLNGSTCSLLNQLLNEFAIDLSAKVEQPFKDCRLQWTMYNNISQWFDTWQQDLLDIGFAEMDDDNEFYLSD